MNFQLTILGIGYSCPVQIIEYTDENNNVKKFDCYFTSGNHKGKSKGLTQMAKELNLEKNKKNLSLPELKTLFENHPIFRNKTRLEELADEFNVKIHFLPKFHCEMSPIEGIWAHQKVWIRKRVTGNFNEFEKLVKQHRDIIINSTLNKKLWRRFWHVINAYLAGKTYGEVLKLYFGSKTIANITEHRKICNFFELS